MLWSFAFRVQGFRLCGASGAGFKAYKACRGVGLSIINL